MWGDTGGGVIAIQFTSASTALFERQSNQPADIQGNLLASRSLVHLPADVK